MLDLGVIKNAWSLILLLFIGTAGYSQPADAPSLLSIVRHMPPEIQKILRGGKPDGQGMVSHNQPDYLGAEYQRGGMDTFLAGVALSQPKLIEEGFRVADVTFAKQTAEGGFGDKVPTGGAFWINACARSFLALKESELWPRYQSRVEAYYPALRSASAFLVNHLDALVKHDQKTPNRLFIDADALFFTSRLLGTDPPAEAALLRDKALALFDQDSGAFQENGGGDSSYQAVNLQMLMLYATFYPSPQMNAIIGKGLEWELTKVGSDGSIAVQGNSRTGVGKEIYFGREKEVNTREVILMFAYAGQLYQTDRYTQTALLIFHHWKSH